MSLVWIKGNSHMTQQAQAVSLLLHLNRSYLTHWDNGCKILFGRAKLGQQKNVLRWSFQWRCFIVIHPLTSVFLFSHQYSRLERHLHHCGYQVVKMKCGILERMRGAWDTFDTPASTIVLSWCKTAPKKVNKTAISVIKRWTWYLNYVTMWASIRLSFHLLLFH